MVFSSVIFLFLFLPIVLGCYYLLPGREAKNLWLVAASLLFYAFSGLWYVLLLLFSVFCNYLAGLFVSGRKSVLYAAVAVNLGILGIFKYLTFLVQTVDRLPGVTIPVPSIVLPVGISFFTFQGLSYVIDVYRNERLKSTHFRDVLLYIALFPQLVAGPIIRYEDVADEIHSRRNTLEQLAKGLRRFIVGLSKKLLIADICGNVVALIYNADRSVLDSRTAWLAAVCYLMQIYFDFSGYSDMAIGLGLCFGFHFKENFNYPYISASIQEFWRRWHISLSTWFKEYVYIPLGGNRRGFARTLLNTAIVWMLTGLWHGASWNFVLWGVYFGIIIIIEKLFLGKCLEKAPAFLSHLYAIFLFTFGWVLFDFTDMGQMRDFIVSLFNGGSVGLISHDALVYVLAYLPVLIISIIASTPLVSNLHKKIENRAWCGYADAALVLIALVLCTASLVSSGYNPFIYFRF